MDVEKIIKDAIQYIKTHKPQETDFKTIDVAISTVARGINAAKKVDLLNRDDAWLIDDDGKLAGIRGRGWAQSLDDVTIRMFYEAVEYSKKYMSEYAKNDSSSTKYDDIQNLKQMRNELTENTLSQNDLKDINNIKFTK